MGYFEVGIFNPRHTENIGSLWRSAYQLGAAGIFTIGRRYYRQPADVLNSAEWIPLHQYLTLNEFLSSRPVGAVLVGIEMGGTPLSQFQHPDRAIYLLGSEANGLPDKVREACNQICTLEARRTVSYNVAAAGSIVLYHRVFLSQYGVNNNSYADLSH
jgi:tRNA G18 (ribose-2'-O)-methylase SpoU